MEGRVTLEYLTEVAQVDYDKKVQVRELVEERILVPGSGLKEAGKELAQEQI
jgi:hypothetical protein